MTSFLNEILMKVRAERIRQDQLWGEQNWDPALWVAILTEEVGEVATEVQEMHFNAKQSENYIKELIQVAAVAVAMVECEYRRLNGTRNPRDPRPASQAQYKA